MDMLKLDMDNVSSVLIQMEVNRMKKLLLNDVQFEILNDIMLDVLDDIPEDVIYTTETYKIYQQLRSLKEV